MPLSRQTLETLYQVMVRIRRFDEKTAELFNAGLVKGTAHSYVGQEAVATGACAPLRHDERQSGTAVATAGAHNPSHAWIACRKGRAASRSSFRLRTPSFTWSSLMPERASS